MPGRHSDLRPGTYAGTPRSGTAKQCTGGTTSTCTTATKIWVEIGSLISKGDTSFRRAIPAHERLAVTLRFLATGDSYHSLMYMFKISKQAIPKIIPNVCDALVNVLQDYVEMPHNESEWKMVAKEFNDKWNFPNCVGAFDGKHIALQAPIDSGTEYFNYKGFFSIVLFAVADAKYNCTYANVGCQGRISGGGVFSETKFKKCLEDNTMRLPSPCALPGRSVSTPFVFLAYDAVPLSNNITKPYPGAQEKGSMKRIFNYRLSRACRVSENTFGIIILRKSISRAIYNPNGAFDCPITGETRPGIWRQAPSTFINIPRIPRRSKMDAQTVRNESAEFLSSPEGMLLFQQDR